VSRDTHTRENLSPQKILETRESSREHRHSRFPTWIGDIGVRRLPGAPAVNELIPELFLDLILGETLGPTEMRLPESWIDRDRKPAEPFRDDLRGLPRARQVSLKVRFKIKLLHNRDQRARHRKAAARRLRPLACR
jgi:hypothetical protein